MELKAKLEEYKTFFILGTIILCLIAFNIYILTISQQENTKNENNIVPIKTKKETQTKIKADIKGQVNEAGVYELNNGDRVIDIINKAGGLTKNADTSLINLSKKLEDEMFIIIYSKAEVQKIKNTNKNESITEICPKINDACPNEKQELKQTNTKETKSTANNKISINTATIEQLQTLNGIGEAKAKAIIKYRDENGNFKTIEEIKNVSGIGDSGFEKIKNFITI